MSADGDAYEVFSKNAEVRRRFLRPPPDQDDCGFLTRPRLATWNRPEQFKLTADLGNNA